LGNLKTGCVEEAQPGEPDAVSSGPLAMSDERSEWG